MDGWELGSSVGLAVSVPILSHTFFLGRSNFFRNFSAKICYELHLVLFGAHDLVQVPNLKNSRLPAIFLLKSRFSFTLPLGFLLALAKGILKEV